MHKTKAKTKWICFQSNAPQGTLKKMNVEPKAETIFQKKTINCGRTVHYNILHICHVCLHSIAHYGLLKKINPSRNNCSLLCWYLRWYSVSVDFLKYSLGQSNTHPPPCICISTQTNSRQRIIKQACLFGKLRQAKGSSAVVLICCLQVANVLLY